MAHPQCTFISISARACALLAWACALPAVAGAASLIPQESSLGLDTVGYFHSADNGPKGFQSTVSPNLVGRWQGQGAGPVLEGGAQADLLLMSNGVVPNAPSTYFELPEMYAGTSLQLAPVQLLAGRKLEQWSHLDEEWNLGIWQPRFRWDYLHPESVGLTGAFLRVEQPLFKLVVWGSPIFIPERGVPISTDGGALASSSRWFIPPPSTVNLFGRQTPVEYTLMMPQMSELVAHPGGSVMARVGREQGAWFSAGYAYKPINQLLLADTGYLDVSATSPIHGVATIYPRVLYHELVSAEGGYESEPLKAWFSVLGEHPFLDQTSADWTAQEVTPSLAMSSTLDFRIAGAAARPTRMDLSFLRQWGGNTGDQGPDATGGGASNFEARYPFQSAVAMGLRSDALARLSASTRLIYDISHQGTIWSTEIRYQPRDRWMLGVGADMMTSLQTDDPEDADLIGHFNANDRVHAGVTYVF